MWMMKSPHWTISNIQLEIAELNLFQDGNEALEFAKEHTVDVAFCDMEMPGLHGLELAKELKAHDPHIRVVFVTAYSQYALDAWSVDATGYLLKPYTASDIRKELGKCTYQKLPSHRVVIQTIPTFSVTVDGKPLHLSAAKPRELLALLVDHGKSGVTTGRHRKSDRKPRQSPLPAYRGGGLRSVPHSGRGQAGDAEIRRPVPFGIRMGRGAQLPALLENEKCKMT